MRELYIETENEKVEMLRESSAFAKFEVCKVVAMREDEDGRILVDIETKTADDKGGFVVMPNLFIGEDCEFTDKAINYAGEYSRKLI